MAPVTMGQVENGEACFMLNVMEYIYGAVSCSTVFRQNIGEDRYVLLICKWTHSLI